MPVTRILAGGKLATIVLVMVLSTPLTLRPGCENQSNHIGLRHRVVIETLREPIGLAPAKRVGYLVGHPPV